jgi:hypothetical protein
MEILGTGVVFNGDLASLSRTFRLDPDDFRACLHELVQAGQLAVFTWPDDRLTDAWPL